VLLGWAGPLAAAALGLLLRVWELGRPHAFVFDETYYAKDALALLRFGTEQQFIEGADAVILGGDGDWRALEVFTGAPAFVVHPPLGKWLIAAGEWTFGMTPTGWRIATVVAGTLSILLLGRIVRRLTGSALLGTIAALLIALDGLAIVTSRTALLDGLLALFVLAAFGALLIDRDRADAAARPGGWRRWRVAAGLLLGAACAVKWSGLGFLVGFGLLTVVWDFARHRRRLPRAAVLRPGWLTLRTDLLPALVSLVGVAAAVYLASWAGWFATGSGWGRTWAQTAGASPWPDALRSWWHYHAQIYTFHVGLRSSHPYESSAWGWFLQARPTSMYVDNEATGCGAEQCRAVVHSLGNPVVWWAGTAALVHQSYRWLFVRDGRAGAVLVAVLAGWLPWIVLFADRTIFTFYAVVLLPFLVAALTMSLGQVLGTARCPGRPARIAATGLFLAAAVAAAAWFLPVWTGAPIPAEDWAYRMWLRTWV
jgi:dolichyl-phosphate-mannose--protein O-mannosyl transferase